MVTWKEAFIKIFNQYRLVFTAAIIIGIMYYPIGWFHELGHFLVAWHSGSTCVYQWWQEGHCEPLPQPFMLYWALGGIFGMIGSSSVLVFRKARINKGLFVGVLTMVFSQFVNFLFETFAHFAYLYSPIAYILMATSEGMIFLALIRFFSPRTKNKT